jgi:hypothetical protein
MTPCPPQLEKMAERLWTPDNSNNAGSTLDGYQCGSIAAIACDLPPRGPFYLPEAPFPDVSGSGCEDLGTRTTQRGMPNWFGPVEAEARDRAGEFLQATYESERREVRGRSRYARHVYG